MTDAEALNKIARLAHELWCERLRREGWRPGPFDAAAKTHDALVPFEQLHPADARSTRAGVEALDIPALLEQAVDYPRGPDREFIPEELRQGLVVESSDGACRGQVESWTISAGALTNIRVRWSDGEVIDHFPPERELRRK